MFWLCLGRIVCVDQEQERVLCSDAGSGPCQPHCLLAASCTRLRILQFVHHSWLSQTSPQTAGCIMQCCLAAEALGPSCQLACAIMGQTANSKRMQEIKETYAFLRIWMTGEESLIWLWTFVIYLEPWSKAAVSLKSVKILLLNSLETFFFSVLCRKKATVENIHRQHFHICVSREEMTLLP